MITNLFSTFDPSTAIFNMSWVSLLLSLAIQPLFIWNNSSTIIKTNNNILTIFNKEVSYSLNNAENGTESIILMVFSLILSLNFIALYPQIFSLTSHLTVTLPISLIFWISLMIFGWINNTNHILSHLVPQGTPTILIIFIVIIELVSNLIRPITLCVRLTANLIAGHLLITLLGNFIITINISIIITLIGIPIILTVLESAVACIQAYVFMTLITLYATEINYWQNNLTPST